MPDFADLIQSGAGYGWLFIPTAILLGALHGLEPGHSKTMMAAFIVAIRGTVVQAALLAVTATISHTATVWMLAILALRFGPQWGLEANEPYFQLASGALIIAIALSMIYAAHRTQRAAKPAAAHGHGAHAHDETKLVDTGHGLVELSVFEGGVPPRFRLHFKTPDGRDRAPADDQVVTVETMREDGVRQSFAFERRGAFLEATTTLPEPHRFKATLTLAHNGHAHAHDVAFTEHVHADAHEHDGLASESADFEDAHQRAHASEIRERFAQQNVTTWQIAMFGLTGGLIPCSAAITVLVLCLQLQKLWLGMTLVLCFSIGLALTLLASGVVAAWGMRHATKRWPGLEAFARRAPYFSSAVVACVGLYVVFQGFSGLARV